MEIDLAQLERNSPVPDDLLRAEICIIGAGIAGLTLAHKLLQLGHEVLIVEAGGHASSASEPPDQILQSGEPHPGTAEPGIHAVGGTSLTWGGQLLPLPAESMWPILAGDLGPFNAEAERILGVDDLPYDAPAFFTRLQLRAPEPIANNGEIVTTISKFARFGRRNLGQTLGGAIASHPKARLITHALATELLPSPDGQRIEAVAVQTPGSEALRITAAQFVLAAGTIETVRLLLASRSLSPRGIGNEHDQVGRNFHDHLTVSTATLHEPARTKFLSALRPWVVEGTVHSAKLSASPALCQQLGLAPVMAHLTIAEPEGSGVRALRALLRAHQQDRLSTAWRASLPQLPRALYDSIRLSWSAVMRQRRYVSRRAAAILRLNAAQHMPSQSRITLSSEVDRNGQPKASLDWHIAPEDLATIRAFTAHLKQTFDPAGSSGFDWSPALLNLAPDPARDTPIPGLDDARHAMGGACMGTDPRTSVVTPDLRVHGFNNLFIASAAVFPDGSPQLPTLPLMALTLRLAEHLHRYR